jgi:hypothetical protein
MKLKSVAMKLAGAFLLVAAFQNCDHFKPSMGLSSNGNPDSVQSLDPAGGAFTCDAAAKPTSTVMRRLNKSEYVNTIKRLLSKQTTSDFNTIMDGIAPFITSIPDDVAPKFSRLDVKIDQAHLNGYLFVAKTLGSMIAGNSTRAKNFFGSCATTADLSASCLDQFLKGPATKIYRHPLTADDISQLKSDFAAFTSDKNSFLIARMLMSPNFLMHVETSGTEVSPGLLQISAYELANRLSYQFQQSMPDDELFAAAADGSLMTDAGLAAQVSRLTGGTQLTQTEGTIGEFFEQWLGLADLPDPEGSSAGAAYASFADGNSLTKASMVQEIEDMTSYYTFTVNGHFNDLLTSDISFAKGADLAAIYGVARWSGDPNNLVKLPADQRSGLLTRAAFLANSTTTTNPVARGVKIRRQILCDTLAPPPTAIANMVRVPPPDPTLSTRQRYEIKTADALCMSCHAQINPLGFAMESFDAWGRFRTVEKIFDDNGQLLSQKPVDPVVRPVISPSDQRMSSSAPEFNQMLADSGKAQNCFIQQYFEFTYRQKPNLQADGCTLESMRENLTAADGSLKKMFLNVAMSPAFKLKNINDP